MLSIDWVIIIKLYYFAGHKAAANQIFRKGSRRFHYIPVPLIMTIAVYF